MNAGPREVGPQQALRVLALAADPSSTITDIRLTAPLQLLADQGLIACRLQAWHACRLADLEGCDVVIGQRPIHQRHLRLLQAAHERGVAVIVEIDDLLTRPATHVLAHAVLQKQVPWVKQALDEADLVSASTARLAAALAAPGRQLHVVPNYASPLAAAVREQTVHRLAHRATQAGPAQVLMASSDAVASNPAFEALRQLQAERGVALQIVAIGPVAAMAQAAGLLVQAHPVMPREAFLTLAGGLERAVAVIPLDDSPFSAGKSAVKWFDFAAIGLPTLMSDRPPYSDVVQHQHTGWLVADEPDAWLATLKSAIDDGPLRAHIAAQAELVVADAHTLTHSAAAWRAVLEEAARARAAGTIKKRSLPWYRHWWAPWHDSWVSLRMANRQRRERAKPKAESTR